MIAEESRESEAGAVDRESARKAGASQSEDRGETVGAAKGASVEGQNEEVSPDRDAADAQGGQSGGGSGEKATDGQDEGASRSEGAAEREAGASDEPLEDGLEDGEVAGVGSSTAIETDDAVVKIVGAGSQAAAALAAGGQDAGGAAGGAESDGADEEGSGVAKGGEAAVGGPEADESLDEGEEDLGLALSVLDGKLEALLEGSMEHSALLREIAETRKGAPAGKGGAGEELQAELQALGKKIDGVKELVSKVSDEVDRSGEKGGGEKTAERLKSWITDTLQAALSRLEEDISRLMNSDSKQIEAFEGVKSDVDVVRKVGEAVGTFEAKLQAYIKDLNKEKELGGGVVRWVLLSAVAVAAPALLLAGAFVGQRWEVLPVEDATGGWRDHVWERYGGDLVGCVRQGLRDQSSFECVVDVRGSVEKVRASASGR